MFFRKRDPKIGAPQKRTRQVPAITADGQSVMVHPKNPLVSDEWMGTRENPHRNAVWDEAQGKMRRKTVEEIEAENTPEARRARVLADRELWLNSLDTEEKKAEARERYANDDAWEEIDKWARSEQARLMKDFKPKFRIAEDQQTWDAAKKEVRTLFRIQLLTFYELRLPGVERSQWGYGTAPTKEQLEVFEHWTNPAMLGSYKNELNLSRDARLELGRTFPNYETAYTTLQAVLAHRPIPPRSVVEFDTAGNQI